MNNKTKMPLVFFNYLISYIIIMVIPVIILSAILFQYTVIRLKKSALDNAVTNIKNYEELLNGYMEELYSIALNLESNEDLTPSSLKNDINSFKEINKYKVNSDYICDIGIYIKNSEYIYTTRGTIYPSNYFKYYLYPTDELTNTTVEIYPIESKKIVTGFRTADNECLIYLWPYPISKPSPFGSLIYIIDKEKLTVFAENILSDIDGYIGIYDETGNSILQFNNNMAYLDDYLYYENNLSGVEGEVENQKIEGHGYVVTKRYIDINGWSIYMIVPQGQFYKDSTQALFIMIISVALTFILSVCLAIYFSKKYYKPIKEMNELFGDGQLVNTRDEIQSIKEKISNAITTNSALLQNLDRNRTYVRKQIIYSLLLGDYNNPDELANYIEKNNVLPSGQPCFVLVVESMRQIEEIIESTFIGVQYYYCLRLLNSNYTAVVLCLEEKDAIRNTQIEMAKAIYNYVSIIEEGIIGIGIGDIYDDVFMIGHSLIEAITALESRIGNMSMNNNIFLYQDIIEPHQNFWYPSKNINKMIQAIKQGNLDISLQTLSAIENDIVSKKVTSVNLKCIYYDIANGLIKLISEMNLSEEFYNIAKVAEYKSYKDFIKDIKKIITEYCQHINASKNNKSMYLYTDILKYINDNITDNKLSLANISEYFNISISYLSQLFKEMNKETYIDYISNLRIDMAKDELLETNDTVKEIAKSVGYIDVASFSKKFKKQTGFSPGEYRRQNFR